MLELGVLDAHCFVNTRNEVNLMLRTCRANLTIRRSTRMLPCNAVHARRGLQIYPQLLRRHQRLGCEYGNEFLQQVHSNQYRAVYKCRPVYVRCLATKRDDEKSWSELASGLSICFTKDAGSFWNLSKYQPVVNPIRRCGRRGQGVVGKADLDAQERSEQRYAKTKGAGSANSASPT